MTATNKFLLATLSLALLFTGTRGPSAIAQEEKPTAANAAKKSESAATSQEQNGVVSCSATVSFFEAEVWAKVAEKVCLRCHNAEGDASGSRFVLLPIQSILSTDEVLQKNCATFSSLAVETKDGEPIILRKVRGEDDHGGGAVLPVDSTGYRILEKYLLRKNLTEEELDRAAKVDSHPFWDGVEMISAKRLWRRITLSLAGRLPNAEELAIVEQRGEAAIPELMDKLMQEPAFYFRLKEGFNDIFLTRGYDCNAETVLSYHHFEKTRHWTEQYDLNHIPEAERQRARWKLADVYRESLLREPMELVEHIVKNDRPFTEIVTADYIMVSPYTARGYGIFEEVKSQFKNPEDPFEYVPARLKALVGRDEKVQESATGMYPHSGLLSTFHYVRRYPTTETNRNRLRARMYFQHFLGIDIMQLAPRVTDAAAVDAKYKVPTMEAPDCVVCHRTVDPIAGLFQDYNEEGHLGPRKDGWYRDMFEPGFGDEKLPAEEKWRAPQWLGERTAKDPRFAVAMVEHVYYLLFGRKVMFPPEDIEDPTFAIRRRAWKEQRRLLERVAVKFRESNFNLKVVFKELALSELYRADRVQNEKLTEDRRAELDEVGVSRMLTPEQLERKLEAVFGKKWGRLEESFAILYGGIDSQTVTERMLEPSGAMGALQRMMANDMACNHVWRDFTKPAAERRFFGLVEREDIPGKSEETDRKIRDQVVFLHGYLLGVERTASDPEVERTFQLYKSIIEEAHARKFEPRETYFCGGREEGRIEDPQYAIRAWRGVMTYLLRQHEFLYE